MKFYVVIPARYDSTRFPGKVLTNINNITMLERVFNNAKKSSATEVFIATDSDKIFNSAKKYTNNVFMTSNKNVNGTERVAELANILKWKADTLVINVQADMPELQYDNINLLAEKSTDNEGLSTLYYDLENPKLKISKNTVKICIDDKNINFCRIVKGNISAKIYKHIGIYAYYVKDLNSYKQLPQSENEIDLSLEQFRFVDNGYKISAYYAVSNPGISIDSSDNLNEIR